MDAQVGWPGRGLLTDFDGSLARIVVTAMLAGRAVAHTTAAAFGAHPVRRIRGGRALTLCLWWRGDAGSRAVRDGRVVHGAGCVGLHSV